MENINYCPYLGIARFTISNKRLEILKNIILLVYQLVLGLTPQRYQEIKFIKKH